MVADIFSNLGPPNYFSAATAVWDDQTVITYYPQKWLISNFIFD